MSFCCWVSDRITFFGDRHGDAGEVKVTCTDLDVILVVFLEGELHLLVWWRESMGVCMVHRWASADAMVGLPASAKQSALSVLAVGPMLPLWVSIVSGSAVLGNSRLSVELPT